MEYIDTFYFINLDRRPDRQTQILEEFKKMEIPIEKTIRVQGFDNKIGILGCVKSHIQAVSHFIQSGKEWCMIFEDDFEFTETKEKVYEVLKGIFISGVEFDCLMLAGENNCVWSDPAQNQYLLRLFFATSPSCYVLTKKYAPALLHNLSEGAAKQEKWINAFGEPENAFNNDYYWIYEQISKRYFFTVPKLGQQRNSASDITPTSKATMYCVKT
jgi:GR25 family glycosyltransferase involved in LPS biosynthesis